VEDAYFALESDPEDENFKHQWVIEQRCTPVLPVLRQSPMPNQTTSTKRRSNILSAYFGPWTMIRRLGSVRSTPFIGKLNIGPEGRRKKRGKVAPAGVRAAWKRHVRGSLPSVSSLELIQNALRTVTTMPDVDDE
ncbi:unnamed protein product, partial [Prorocentrum cordatum]